MKLTVAQYQELYSIHKTETDDLERSIQYISVVTGKTPKEIEDMPLVEFNNLSRDINKTLSELLRDPKPVSFLPTNGNLYQINFKVSTLTAGQVVDLNHWLKGDVIENLDKILATIAVPITQYWWVKLPSKKKVAHIDIAEDMKAVSFPDAYGCVVFFCKLFASSIKAILPYLESEIMKTGMTREQTERLRTDLMKILDGYTTSSE